MSHTQMQICFVADENAYAGDGRVSARKEVALQIEITKKRLRLEITALARKRG